MAPSRTHGSGSAGRERSFLRWLVTGGAALSLALTVVPVHVYDPPTHTAAPMSVVGLVADGQAVGVFFAVTLALWVGLAAWVWWHRAGFGWVGLAALSLSMATGVAGSTGSYSVTWHGVDGQGRRVVDLVTANPGAGTVVIVVSMAAFAAAGGIVTLRALWALRGRSGRAHGDSSPALARSREDSPIRWLTTGGALLSLALFIVPVYEYSDPNTWQDPPMTIVGLLAAGDPEGPLLVAAMAVWLTLAGWSWWRRAEWVWLSLGGLSLVAAALATVAASQYSIIWHGVDPQGRETGGQIVATPGLGTVVALASMAAVAAACILVVWRRVGSRGAGTRD